MTLLDIFQYQGRRQPIGGGFRQAYYVDATNGDDNNPGISPNKPWKTIAKVNGETFNPGDQILFKRGETWTDTKLILPSSGTSSSSIILSDYGSGALPIIDADTQNRAIDTNGKSYLVFQNLHLKGATAGATIKITGGNTTIQNCTVEGDVSELSNGIEVDTTALDISTSNINILNNTVFNCKVRSGGGAGIMVIGDGTSNASYVLIEGNTVYDNGTSSSLDHGVYSTTSDNVTVRRNLIYGNTAHGIAVNGTVTNFTAERNAIYTNGSSGIRLTSSPAAGGNIYQNNLIYGNVGTGIQISAGCLQADIFHNTLVNNATSPPEYGFHIFDGALAIVIKNNVILQDATVLSSEFAYPIRISHADVLTDAGNVFDNNMYYYPNRSVPRMASAAGTGKNLAEWQAMSGSPDPNSQYDDPDFVSDYTVLNLQFSSPCIGNGATGTSVIDDYDGIIRGSPPDIGAYEYVS